MTGLSEIIKANSFTPADLPEFDVPGWIGWRQKAGINDAAPDGRSLGVSYGQIA
jgi:hypothetical protein